MGRVLFYAAEDYAVARADAERVRAMDFPTAVLNTIDYANLGKPGQEVWVVCAGLYATRAVAEGAAERLAASGVSDACAKEIY